MKVYLTICLMALYVSNTYAKTTEGDYRKEWLAGDKAKNAGLPSSIDVGFIYASVNNQLCPFKFPVQEGTYLKAVKIECDNKKAIYLSVIINGAVYVKFKGKTHLATCSETVLAVRSLFSKNGYNDKCSTMITYKYYDPDFTPPQKKQDW
jgi:hypothetical protein